MYAIERNRSAWLCTTTIEAFEVDAVRIRLQGKVKAFAEFQQRLDNWEHIDGDVISIYKCSKSTKCEDCIKYKGCEVLQKVQETAQAHAEFFKWVEYNGGYTF